MPAYNFTAKSQDGRPHSGTREARDQYELARSLRQEGYLLISARIAKERTRPRISFSFFGRVSLKDKLMLVRNLKVMISAGVSLPKALKTLASQAKNRKLSKALNQISEEIIKGKSFSEALFGFPEVFSQLFCHMVKVGEEAGTLEENLGILIRQMEREYELKSKIKGALMYPSVIIAAMVGIGVMMLVMVVPQLAKTFEDLQIELPLTTRVIIGLGNFMVEKWYFLILIVAALVFAVKTALGTQRGKKLVGAVSLRMPIVSPIVKKTNAAYTVRTLSSLISAGVPLVRSLEILGNTLENFYFKRAIVDSIDKIKQGKKLSEALKPYSSIYPVTVLQMIEVGEETGETAEVLEKLSQFFEEEVTAATKNLAAVVEPVLMLIIGGVVGFFAISMVQPMYSMLGGIK